MSLMHILHVVLFYLRYNKKQINPMKQYSVLDQAKNTKCLVGVALVWVMSIYLYILPPWEHKQGEIRLNPANTVLVNNENLQNECHPSSRLHRCDQSERFCLFLRKVNRNGKVWGFFWPIVAPWSQHAKASISLPRTASAWCKATGQAKGSFKPSFNTLLWHLACSTPACLNLPSLRRIQ